MPNKTWNLGVDLLPSTGGAFNLGNASKKWVINGYSLGAACEKGITDNTTETAASSTDTNLVTGRTVYYALQHAAPASITNSEIDALFED